MSSWLNLSNIANNVTNFTKEVLTDAARADDELDSAGEQSKELNDFDPASRDELLYLRSEVTQRDEHIANLQDELDKLRTDFKKHTSNLKNHLLQKDEEIDAYAEKLNNSELILNEQIGTLTSEKNRLEKELSEKMSATETDNESDWGNDWGGSNDAEVSTLREENESLCNEVSMKEIVLGSIETKMRQLSGGKHLDASEFTTWIDDYLEKASQEKEKATNLTELVLYLKEEIEDDSSGDDIDLDSVYDWVAKGKEEKVALERKITKLENTIVSIEDSIRSFNKDSQNFKISDLSDWLATLSSPKTSPRIEEKNHIIVNSNGINDEDKNLLMAIQESVRDFDEEDAGFEIKDFQKWIEKVQNKIDDLEVELLNDQDIKDTEVEQRITERAKLKEMFDEKDREIGLLKVELYNRTQGMYQPSSDIVSDNSNALQEQLNEAMARSEALQNELSSSKENIQLLELQLQQLKESSLDNDNLTLALDKVEKEKQDLQTRLDNVHNQLDHNQSDLTVQLQNKQEEILELHVNLDEARNKIKHANVEMQNVLADVDTLQNLLEGIPSKNETMTNRSNRQSDVTERLFKTTNDVMEYVETLKSNNKASEQNLEELEVQLKDKVDENSSHQIILTQVLETLSSELFTSQPFPESFTTTPPPKEQNVYTSYLNTSIAHLKNEQQSFQNDFRQQVENLQEQIRTLELENASVTTAELQQKEQRTKEENKQISALQLNLQEATTTLQQQEQQTSSLLEEIEDLKDQNNDLEMYNGAYQREVEQLKVQLEEFFTDDSKLTNVTEELQSVNKMLEQRNSDLESLQKENSELNTDKQKLQESLKEIQQQQSETTKSNSPSESSGGGVKFGVLKRKIKELEESNEKLQNEITALKQQSSQISSLTDAIPSGENNLLIQEIEELKEQNSDLQNYNSAYQKEVEQLKQQLEKLSTDDSKLTNVTEELQRMNKMSEQRNTDLESLQKENNELNTDKQKLQESLKEMQQQQSETTKSNSPSDSSEGGVKFGVLKRKIKELEESNEKLQNEITVLRQSSQISSLTDAKPSAGENNQLTQEIEELRKQNSDLQNYNSAYQREVEQLKQQFEGSSTTESNQVELQENLNSLNQQLQQYQTYCTNIQTENEHLKRLSQASMAQGTDQDVAVKMELQNQISVLTNENHHYQTEYENLRQSWIKYQQESATYMESLQQQNQQLQMEYQQCQQQQQHSLQSSLNSQPPSIDPTTTITSNTLVATAGSNSHQFQDKIHNLSLMLTEKTEECARLQQENDNTKAQLVEVQNDISDMELIREECKQLKAMLMNKGDEETISNLQMENKRLKQQIDQIQKLDVEKNNDLSDMELLREECRQLKLMLVNKDSPAQFQQLEEQKTKLEHSLLAKDDELTYMNASLIEMQNSLSDMDLVREECKQLKTMLMNSTNNQQQQNHQQPTSLQSDYDDSYKELEARLKTKEDEVRHKDSIIYEMQNTSGDVELLRQQCEQLKSMLSEKEGANSTFNDSSVIHNTTGMDNSFMVQVQQLEEVMREKDHVISEKELLLNLHLNRIRELENSVSDMELLYNECRALKEMIGEKETMFAELQNDLDLANNIVEQRHSEISVKDTENKLLRDQIKELSEGVASKDVEILNMRDEMQEAVLQDENIHLLQTEYRNVEEQLKGKEKELAETQQRLFEMETHCERMKVYEEQYQTLKNTLKEKDADLQTLQLQSSDNSILESETVTLLQQKLNQLKSLLYAKENETVEITKVLEKKNLELQDYSNSFNRIQTELDAKQMQAEELHQQLQQAKDNTSTSNPQPSQDNVNDMESQVMYYKSMAADLNSKNNNFSETLRDMESKCVVLSKERDDLQLLQEEYKAAADLQNIQIQQLQQNMRQNEEQQRELIERLTVQSSKTTHSVEGLQQEKQIVDVFVSNLNALLQVPSSQAECGVNRSTELSEIMQQVQVLLNTLQQRDALLQRMQENHQSQIERLNQDLLGKSKQLDDSLVQFKESEFKMTDLQSQVQEYQELELMYQTKCQECDQLQSTLHQFTETSKLQQQELQSTLNSEPQESEHLREELLKNSNSLLDKNKECDQLKLEILQLEEKVFNQEQLMNQTLGAGAKLQELNVMCQRKDQEIQRLQLQLEDNAAVLESGEKEKAFLDQLVMEKNTLAAEKEELVFQYNQLNGRLQEQDVALKYKDTNSKEVEAKTKRELERLRNHLVMIEENHTKDILECQEREDSIRVELETARETLGKKSIILQDSSKQFQEHVGTLEEQLHAIAAQRDANTLELEKTKEHLERDSAAIYNLQNALEQLQREKEEQYEYLTSVEKRKQDEYEARIDELEQEQAKAQNSISEASLAVQGITKLNLELEQKERELQVSAEKINELSSSLQEKEIQYAKILQASDGKMEKSLIRNLLEKYFQAPEDNRADIVKVIGGLLGMSHDQIRQIGTGAAPSKVGGWISNVWGYAATPKKSGQPPESAPKVDPNQSFSEMFIKFLEHESTNKQHPVDSSASLANAANVPVPPNMLMLSSTTPDILAFHNKSNEELNSSTTIPAPGQEIPRVHTHHAQSTLKTLLS